MASSSDDAGGDGAGRGGGGEIGGGRGSEGGVEEQSLHRMHRLQPVIEMTCSIFPSSSERSISSHGGTLVHRDVNRLIIVESADDEMRFIDDVTDSDSIDDDVMMTKTPADSDDRDDESQRSAQVLQQTSMIKHPSAPSCLAAEAASASSVSNSSSSGHSEPLFENINANMTTSDQATPQIKSPQPISEHKANHYQKSSAGIKRRVSEPRIRILFNTLHDRLTQQRKSDNSGIIVDSESRNTVLRRPNIGTPPPSTKRLSLTPLIVRRQSTAAAAQINISSAISPEMSHQEWAAGATPKKSTWLKRRTSESSNDSKVSEGSSDRPGKDVEDADDQKSRGGDPSPDGRSIHPANESSVTTPGGHPPPSPKQRHLFTFLRSNKDSTTNQSSQRNSSSAGQRLRHGSGGLLPERTTAPVSTKNGPTTPTTLTPFSSKTRSPFAAVDACENSDISEIWKRDNDLGLDKQRMFSPGERSSRRNSRGIFGVGDTGSVRSMQTKAATQETSSKVKDKNVFRTFLGRVRSMSISQDPSKVLVDLNYTDSNTSTSAAKDENDADYDAEATPVPTDVRPSFHRIISLEESSSPDKNIEGKSPLWKRRLSRPTKLKQHETDVGHRPRAHSVIALRPAAPLDIRGAKKPRDTTDVLDYVLPAAAVAVATPAAAADRSKHLSAKINLSSRKSSSLPDLLNPSEEEIRKLQAGGPETDVVALFVDEKKIEKPKTGRRASAIPKESSAEQERVTAQAISASSAAAGIGADDAGVDPVNAFPKRRRSTLAEIHSLAVNVFNRRSTTTNPNKSQLKLFDSKREVSSRLKHLRLISDNYEVNKLKQFYNENYSYIYYLFHEGFTAAELVLSTKASRNPQREDMDLVLYTLERILCVLPDLINKRWQCHSLGQIMSKLMRCAAFQKDGIRLFIAWYSILMDNATENCDHIFRNLIPISDRGIDLMQNSGSLCFYLEWVLKCLVTEAAKVMWRNQEASFEFLFRKFYQYYVLRIFPDFDATDIYSPSNDALPQPRTSQVGDAYLPLQDVIVRWVTEFMQLSHSGMPPEKISFGIVPEKVPKDKPDMLTGAGVIFHASSPEGQKTYTENECAMVRSVFYMSRENVNIVLEILHQALLVSLRHSRIAKRVITVYRHWFQSRAKPAFMEEPNEPGTAKTLTDRPALSLNGCQRQGSSTSSSQSVAEVTDVAVGQQRTLQVFVTQSMFVFIRDWKNLNQKLRESPTGLLLLGEQVDLCKATLGVYRYVAMNVYMTRQTWTHLLTALLRITSYILDSTSPKQKMQSLAGELASTLLQTLIVTWIRANLNFGVSKDLWNQLLAVLSSLTDWPEVIQEWAQALEVLTAILASVVYNVDAKSLSADQTKDQKSRFIKNKQSSKDDGSEDGSKSQSDAETNRPNRPNHPPRSGHPHRLGFPSLQQRRQKKVVTGSKHQSLHLRQQQQPQQHTSGLLMLRMPHDALASVSSHDVPRNLVRSASETNLLSPSSFPKDRPLSDCHMKSLDSLDVDHETSADRLWTLKKQQLTIADSNATLRHVEETVSLTRSPNGSSVRADGSYADDDVQSRSSTLERTTESPASDIINPPSLYHLQEPVNTSSPTTEDNLFIGHNGNRTNVTSPTSQDVSSDSDSRKLYLANISNLSSIVEDGASVASTESFNSDWYPSGSSEMTPDSSVAGATAYDSPSLSSSSADRHLHSSTDSASMSGGSPGYYRAGSHPLRLSEDSSVFLESETDVQADEDVGVAGLASKHGTVGWTPEVAELMWRRVLGLLGDVNSIEDAESHATVFDCLRITTETLLKVHNKMTLQRLDQKTPPILVIAPWVFQALTLPNKYLKGKVLAYRLLCLTMLQPYTDVPVKHLLRFYLVLHRGLVHSSNDVVNVLIKHCASQFFLMPLDGATILLLDFIHAATGIITVSAGQTQAPTFEAMSLLGSLICFPNHFGKMSVLTPAVEEVSLTSVNDVYVKDCIINVLLSNSACRETSQPTSCVRVCALGIYIYEELSHGTMHSKIRDAVEAILDSVKESTDQMVKLVSLDMLSLLTNHSQLLLSEFPDLPRLIIEELVSFVEHCLLSAKKASQTVNFKVLTNTLFCILAWVMSVPVALLLSVCLSPRNANNCLLNRIFNVLQVENIPQVVDHNSNYQTLPTNARHAAEHSPSAQLSKYNDKIAGSESNLLTQDRSMKSSHAKVKEPGSSLVPVVKAVRMHLLNYLGHYPMGQNGTSRLDSRVLECHDISNDDCLGIDIMNRPDVQFLVWNECLLISLNELPSDEVVDEAGSSSGMVTRDCRVIVRDMSGKHCYDLKSLFPGPVQKSASAAGVHEGHPDIISSTSSSSSSRGNPDTTSVPVNSIDVVDAILEKISRTSPECRLYDGEFLNCIFPLPKNVPLKIEEMMVDCIAKQCNLEDDYLSSASNYDARCKAEPLMPGHLELESNWPFQACRQFMSRMGYLTSEHRNQIDLLRKSEQLIRDIRHLDTLVCRETHKIAVIYVGGGQEDKQSILLNEHGSQAYEDFITGLGWKVSLEFHEGYMGGLQRNKTNGEMAIYFSTSTAEIIFHVSTIMPSSAADSDAHQKKVRHLGNDEVHIVWSDHHRRYHRNILNTEFADVIIVIYPLCSGLFHVQILKKPEVGFFGPLFDGSIVDSVVLPSLVRATALNASRTIRAKKQHYEPYYEERDSCLKNIVSKHSELATREEFISDIFLPDIVLTAFQNFTALDQKNIRQTLLCSTLSFGLACGLRHSATSTILLNNQKAVDLVAQSNLRQLRPVRGKKPKKPT